MLNLCTSYNLAILCLSIHPKEIAQIRLKREVQECSQKHYSKPPNTGKIPNTHQNYNELTGCFFWGGGLGFNTI